MKLSELLQTAYRKVVEWFFRPVPAFRIVEPFDEVKDSSSLFAGRHYFLDIIFFRLLDVVSFLQYFRRIWRGPVFAGSIRLE